MIHFCYSAYSSNNPVNYTDPSGHFPIPIPPIIPTIISWGVSLANWWTGADVGYTGSGAWAGHGPRQLDAAILNVNGSADNLGGMMINGYLQNDSVTLTGRALDKLEQDPELARFESAIIANAKNDLDYGSAPFSFSSSRDITFGGERSAGDMGNQLIQPWKNGDTWSVGFNETTWMVRWAPVTANTSVSKSGSIRISYSLEDVQDLRPVQGRSNAYNTVTRYMGFFYHDLLACNDKMKVNANWSVAR